MRDFTVLADVIPKLNRRDCRFDHLIRAAITQGFGNVLVYGGIETEERGHEIRRGLYRCAKHRKITADAGPSHLVTGDDQMGLRRTGRTFELRFRVWGKRDGRKRHLERYGKDRSAWPYDPLAPNRDETGQPVHH